MSGKQVRTGIKTKPPRIRYTKKSNPWRHRGFLRIWDFEWRKRSAFCNICKKGWGYKKHLGGKICPNCKGELKFLPPTAHLPKAKASKSKWNKFYEAFPYLKETI